MPSLSPDASRLIAALTRHQPALEAFCHARLGSRQDAQEVLQSICVKLWEFLPWAFAVARFMVLAHVRDKVRDRLVFDEDVVLAMAEETEVVATGFEDRRQALTACHGKVKPELRELLQEYYLAGRTVRELSAATGRGESAAKMSLLRLREQLGVCIQRQLRLAP